MSRSFSLSPSSCFFRCTSAFFSSASSRKRWSCSSMSSAQSSRYSCSSSRNARARWSTRLLSNLRCRIFSWRSRCTWASRAFSIWSKPIFSRSSATISVIFLPATLRLALLMSTAVFFSCSSFSLQMTIWAFLRFCSSRSTSRRLRSSSCRTRSASASRASCRARSAMASRSWISLRRSLSSLRRSISSLRWRMSFDSSSMRLTMFCESCCFSSFSFLCCSSGATRCMACWSL
mmetsp:Transcript_114922/g.371415  ORF Transcript_114922/g.371415 Transcript_114922/m.371415 type:complete len:233 (+) Transcript_114922:404-1102(+)